MMMHRFATSATFTLPLEGRVAKLGPKDPSVAREGVLVPSTTTDINAEEQSHG
jgi:hypothetical protein